MIQRSEARRLSAKNEWSLISSSLPPALEALSTARLKSKIVRARNLRQKYQDLYRRQKLSSRSRMTGTPHEKLSVRTARKKQMFEEAMVRLRLQLGKTSASAEALVELPPRRTAQTSTSRVHSRSGLQTDRRRQSLRDRAASPGLPKAVRKRMAGQKRRHSHVAASGRRRQTKRDSVNRK